MVAGYHLIWTAYGWWLPNDRRGSMSHDFRCADIAPLGEIHYGRKKIQPAGRIIREFYEAARDVLKHSLLCFTEEEIETIAEAFAEVIVERRYTCYACAILPDHVHLLIRKHRAKAEEMIANLQEASRAAVLAKPQAGREVGHPVWGGPGWKVFLETRGDMERVVRYVERNPGKAGRPAQVWPFVNEYDGWMPGRPPSARGAKPQAGDASGG